MNFSLRFIFDKSADCNLVNPKKELSHNTITYSMSLMIKYSKMEKEIPSRLVFGSHVAFLDCTLPGVQVTAGLRFFSAFRSFDYVSEDSDSLLHKPQASLQVPSGIVKIETC